MAEAAGDIFGPINAETGDTSQFSSFVTADGVTFAASSGSKAHGDYGFIFTGDGSHSGEYGVIGFTDKTEIYVRFYVYMPADQIATAAWANIIPFYLNDGATNLVAFALRCNASAVPYNWRITGDQITAANSATNFSLDAWHYVEIHWKAGTGANGGAVVKVEGDTVFDDQDNNCSTRAADVVRFGNPSGTMVDGDYYYLDDLIGSTTAIGEYAESGGNAPTGNLSGPFGGPFRGVI
jgi:hypothetical protein